MAETYHRNSDQGRSRSLEFDLRIPLFCFVLITWFFFTLCYEEEKGGKDPSTANSLNDIDRYELKSYFTFSRLNINTATLEEITILPGIGPKLASAIIAYRNENGDIKSLDEMKNIHGIGSKTVTQLSRIISF